MPGLSGNPNGAVGKKPRPRVQAALELIRAPASPVSRNARAFTDASSRQFTSRSCGFQGRPERCRPASWNQTGLGRNPDSTRGWLGTLTNHFRKQRSTLLPVSAVISLLGFINGSSTNFFDLAGDARAGIGTSLQGVVIGLGEIAIAFLSLTLDFCIKGPRGFAVGAITFKVATFI